MEELNAAQKIAVWLLPVLFAITVHEVAHGWVANKLGDSTARMMGRLTLNPIKHIDPIGTVLIPAITLLTSGFIFGWARPVPVTWQNLRQPRRDMALVAVAGPAANLLMALVWALVLKVGVHYHAAFGALAQPLILMGVAGIFVNTLLLLVNLVPVPPLDGGRLLTGILPRAVAVRFNRIEPFGIFIVLGLLITGILWAVINPFLSISLTSLVDVAGVSWLDFRVALAIIQ